MSLPQRCARVLRMTALALALSASPALAQSEGTRNPVANKQIISANPFLIMFEWFNAEYERKVTPSSTLGMGAAFLSLDDGDAGYRNVSVFWRYYPQEAALTGFFIGPKLGFYRVTDEPDFDFDDEESGSAFGYGFELGYAWLLGADRNFGMSIGVGATRLIGGDVGDASVTVPTLRLVNIGWAF